MYPVLGVVPRTVRIAIVEMSGDEIQRNAQPFRVSDQVPHVLYATIITRNAHVTNSH